MSQSLFKATVLPFGAFSYFIQGIGHDAGTVSSDTLTFTSSVTAGSTLVLAIRRSVGSDDLTSVSDNINGSWTRKLGQVESVGGHYLHIFTFENSAAGSITVTITFSNSILTRWAIAEYKSKGVDGVCLGSDISSTTATPSTANKTTKYTTETLISIYIPDTTSSTIVENESGSSPTNWQNRINVGTGALVWSDVRVTAAGTYGETWNQGTGSTYATAILALKAPASDPQLIQHIDINATANTPHTSGSLGAAVTSGNCVTGVLNYGANTAVTSVTDDKGNSYNFYRVQDAGNGQDTVVFWLGNITNAPTTITVNGPSSTVGFSHMELQEWSGVARISDPNDGFIGQLQTTPGASADACVSTSITTTADGDLIICFSGGSAANVGIIGTGFTSIDNSVGASGVLQSTAWATQATHGSIQGTYTANAASGSSHAITIILALATSISGSAGSSSGSGAAASSGFWYATTASTLVPDADSSVGPWKNESGSTPLYTSIDEASPGQSDYIRSTNNPTSDICKISLSNPSGAIQDPFEVSYQYYKVGSDSIDLRVQLMETTTVIATWTHTNISATPTIATQVLTSPQLASIGNPNNLFLEFKASV